MSSAPPNRLRFALRLCFGCFKGICWWCVALLLCGLLAALAFVHSARDLPAPGLLLRMMEKRLASSHASATFGKTSFDPSGRILIEDFRLFASGFEEPVLTARAILIRLDWWRLLIGDFDPDEIRLSEASLFCPAILSPSGIAEPVLRDIELTLTESRNLWRIDELTLRSGPMTLSATGAVPRISSQDRRRQDPERLLRTYLNFSRHFVRIAPDLERLARPHLTLRVQPAGREQVLIVADLTADDVRVNEDLALETVHGSARVGFLLQGDDVSGTFHLTARRASFREDFAEAVSLSAAVRLTPASLFVLPESVRIAAALVETPQHRLHLLNVHLQTDEGSPYRSEGSFVYGTSPVSFQGELDWPGRSGVFRLGAKVQPGDFESVVAAFNDDLADKIQLTGPARADAVLEFTEGAPLERLEADLQLRGLTAAGIHINRASGRVVIKGDRIEATELFATQGTNHAYGSYHGDLKTRDFRFLLQGALEPMDLDPWFQGWWTQLWDDFSFYEEPRADLDISGRWGTPMHTRVFGSVETGPMSVRGLKLDRAGTRLFVAPDRVHLLGLEAGREEGAAEGWWIGTRIWGEPGFSAMRFSAVSDLDPHPVAEVFAEAGLSLLAPYTFSKPPQIEVSGTVLAPGSDNQQEDLRIRVSSDSPLTFHGFPLEHLEARAELKQGELDVRIPSAGFSRGIVKGTARLSGPEQARRLALDASLKQAGLELALQALAGFEERRKGGAASEPNRRDSINALPHAGFIDLALSAEGAYNDPFSFYGTGRGEVTESDFGHINLFGPLSELLRRTIFNFTTLKLTGARSSFALDGTKIHFDDLRVTGPTAAIAARGEYDLLSRGLNFNANVFPFRESSLPLAGMIGIVLSPISHVLQVRLSGQLEDPSWRLSFAPIAASRETTGRENLPPLPVPLPQAAPPRPPLPVPGSETFFRDLPVP